MPGHVVARLLWQKKYIEICELQTLMDFFRFLLGGTYFQGKAGGKVLWDNFPGSIVIRILGGQSETNKFLCITFYTSNHSLHRYMNETQWASRIMYEQCNMWISIARHLYKKMKDFRKEAKNQNFHLPWWIDVLFLRSQNLKRYKCFNWWFHITKYRCVGTNIITLPFINKPSVRWLHSNMT